MSIELRAVCDWQIFGEIADPAQHVLAVLSPWNTADPANKNVVFSDNEHLTNVAVTFADNGGPFGLCFVQFEVLLFIEQHEILNAYEVVSERLNRYIGDTDVQVRWLTRNLR